MAAGQKENTACFIEFGIKDRFKAGAYTRPLFSST